MSFHWDGVLEEPCSPRACMRAPPEFRWSSDSPRCSLVSHHRSLSPLSNTSCAPLASNNGSVDAQASIWDVQDMLCWNAGNSLASTPRITTRTASQLSPDKPQTYEFLRAGRSTIVAPATPETPCVDLSVLLSHPCNHTTPTGGITARAAIQRALLRCAHATEAGIAASLASSNDSAASECSFHPVEFSSAKAARVGSSAESACTASKVGGAASHMASPLGVNPKRKPSPSASHEPLDIAPHLSIRTKRYRF